MKVRVCYTTEVNDHLRRAIGYQWGLEGLASREQIQEWFRQNGCENCDDILSDYDNHVAGLEFQRNEQEQQR